MYQFVDIKIAYVQYCPPFKTYLDVPEYAKNIQQYLKTEQGSCQILIKIKINPNKIKCKSSPLQIFILLKTAKMIQTCFSHFYLKINQTYEQNYCLIWYFINYTFCSGLMFTHKPFIKIAVYLKAAWLFLKSLLVDKINLGMHVGRYKW